MTQTFTLAQQIEEVERELGLRREVYAKIAASKPRQKSKLEFHMGRMEAVLLTLKEEQQRRQGTGGQ